MYSISEKNHQLRRLFIRTMLMFAVIWITGSFFTLRSYAKNKNKKGENPTVTVNEGGGSLASDKVVTGTTNLLNDAIPVLQVIGAIVCSLLAVYFFIRKANADEQDQKMWKNRITICIISAVGIVTVGGIITTVVSYYK